MINQDLIIVLIFIRCLDDDIRRFFPHKYKLNDNRMPFFVKKTSSDIRCFQRIGILQQKSIIDKEPPVTDLTDKTALCCGLDRTFLLSKPRGRKDIIANGFSNILREAG